ncbi:unnamed protein product [Enterobius vermicularis]|uniref:Histidine kinase n=1 Tax=Enterobius vermicularis TaxID=51028 RepID=A0A0N4V7H8_ENTVE|nr:unnamed protein product [Enterobius vermicularis]
MLSQNQAWWMDVRASENPNCYAHELHRVMSNIAAPANDFALNLEYSFSQLLVDLTQLAESSSHKWQKSSSPIWYENFFADSGENGVVLLDDRHGKFRPESSKTFSA